MNTEERLMDTLDKYYSLFGDCFPTMCFQSDTNEELIQKADRCIKEERTAKDLFHLDYDNDY